MFLNRLRPTISRIGIRGIIIHKPLTVRLYSTADPDASKPTLDIDPFAKAQRLKRPTSPHLTIYQPQLTWYMSAGHRITGAIIGGAFYLGAMTYAVAPFASSVAVAAVHSYPWILLFGLKLFVGAPFFYHSFNGLRHLMWDTAHGLELKGVYSSGHAVLGLTAVTSLLFALFW